MNSTAKTADAQPALDAFTLWAMKQQRDAQRDLQKMQNVKRDQK